MNASRHKPISEAYMEGAYDSGRAYRLLGSMRVKPIIKPRRNARTDQEPPERCRSVMTLKTLGDNF